MQDKRLTIRLTNYWNLIRKEDILPAMDRFNKSALEDIMTKCCIYKVEISGNSNKLYSYEFVGSNLKEAFGKDMTGQMFSTKLKTFPAARVINKIESVIEQKQPVVDEGQFINEKSQLIKYRSCLLPFGNREGRVTNILLGLSWAAF
jgi:hypothetical protein